MHLQSLIIALPMKNSKFIHIPDYSRIYVYIHKKKSTCLQVRIYNVQGGARVKDFLRHRSEIGTHFKMKIVKNTLISISTMNAMSTSSSLLLALSPCFSVFWYFMQTCFFSWTATHVNFYLFFNGRCFFCSMSSMESVIAT